VASSLQSEYCLKEYVNTDQHRDRTASGKRGMTTFRTLVIFAVFTTWPIHSLASEFTAKVVGVLDGDTIEVLHDNHAERIRLNAIDCPEKGQAYGQRGKQAASEVVFGKEVKLKTHGKDKYGPDHC
jgi:micrococcal nuclease